MRRVEGKIQAEQDTHPRSADWLAAPLETMELYLDLADLGIESLKAGAPLAQIDWVDEDGEVSRPAFSLNGPGASSWSGCSAATAVR